MQVACKLLRNNSLAIIAADLFRSMTSKMSDDAQPQTGQPRKPFRRIPVVIAAIL